MNIKKKNGYSETVLPILTQSNMNVFIFYAFHTYLITLFL